MVVRDQFKATGSKVPAGRGKLPALDKAASAAKHSPALVTQGDIAPMLTAEGVQDFLAAQATEGKQQAAVAAIEAIRRGRPELSPDSEPIKAILAGAAPDDAAPCDPCWRRLSTRRAARRALRHPRAAEPVPRRDRNLRRTSDELAENWRRGYPYKFRCCGATMSTRNSSCRPSCSSCRPG